MAVRGIRSGRGNARGTAYTMDGLVVDVHRRFAAQVHGHLELHHGDDLTPGALCRVAKCPVNNAEIPHALSVTLPAGFGRFTAMNSISPTQIESGVSPRKVPAQTQRAVGQVWARVVPLAVFGEAQAENLQPTSRSDILNGRVAPGFTGAAHNRRGPERVVTEFLGIWTESARLYEEARAWEVMAGGGATVEELKDVLRETLENRGALGNVRAHLRAEVSNALEDRTGLKRPDISNENLIINELIREYLVFNRYRSSSPVMLARERPAGHAAV